MTIERNSSAESTKLCWACEREIGITDKFCRHCGASPLHDPAAGQDEQVPIPEQSMQRGSQTIQPNRSEVTNGWPDQLDSDTKSRTRNPPVSNTVVRAIPNKLLLLGLVFLVAVVGIGIVYLFTDVFPVQNFLSAKLNCSDEAVTDLVIQIARREMANDRYQVPAPSQILDNENTIITLEGVRTRTTNERVAECAAAINFRVVFRPGGKYLENMRARLEGMTNKEITYIAERTDNGQLYVTVSGLPDW
jgi:hypothetical protein